MPPQRCTAATSDTPQSRATASDEISTKRHDPLSNSSREIQRETWQFLGGKFYAVTARQNFEMLPYMLACVDGPFARKMNYVVRLVLFFFFWCCSLFNRNYLYIHGIRSTWPNDYHKQMLIVGFCAPFIFVGDRKGDWLSRPPRNSVRWRIAKLLAD